MSQSQTCQELFRGHWVDSSSHLILYYSTQSFHHTFLLSSQYKCGITLFLSPAHLPRAVEVLLVQIFLWSPRTFWNLRPTDPPSRTPTFLNFPTIAHIVLSFRLWPDPKCGHSHHLTQPSLFTLFVPVLLFVLWWWQQFYHISCTTWSRTTSRFHGHS